MLTLSTSRLWIASSRSVSLRFGIASSGAALHRHRWAAGDGPAGFLEGFAVGDVKELEQAHVVHALDAVVPEKHADRLDRFLDLEWKMHDLIVSDKNPQESLRFSWGLPL